MKKLLTILAVVSSVLSGVVLAQDVPARDSLRFVVVVHGSANDPFWSVIKNGVDQAAKDMGVKVEYRAPETFDMVLMSQLIDAAVASNPDGMVVSIPDAAALGESIQAGVASGIPIVSIDSGQEVYKELGVLRHLGMDEYQAGFQAGERLAAQGITRALCVNHEVGNVSLDLRCQGFSDGLGGTVEVLAVSKDPVEIRNAVTGALNAGPGIEAILTLGPLGAEPTLDALEQLGKSREIVLGTFDLSPSVLQALVEGKMSFAIDAQQYMQGYLAIVLLTLKAEFGLLPGADVFTGPGFVTPDTAAQVISLSAAGIR